MKRSKFSLSYSNLLTCNMGELIPCGLLEVLPGDTIQMKTSALLRCSPLLAPVMHPVHVRFHHWYVPNRLVWDSFEDFITAGPAGTSLPTFPTITSVPGVAVGTLADYLGVPTSVPNITYSALPTRGYQLIWNEWYRDQDLETEVTVSKADGNDTTTSGTLKNCAWEKDYFTSARPWPQKGPTITIPIGDRAAVHGIAFASGVTQAAAGITWPNEPTPSTPPAGTQSISATAQAWGASKSAVGTAGNTAFTPANANIYADLSTASAITINALREALALQRFEEARAQYGSRYTEYLRYLGVTSSDARLQRPEYLGGGRETIQFSEVLQTAEGTSPVGEMRGHGIAGVRSNRYRRFIEEHGFIHTFMSIRPKTIYANGLYRHFNRRSKEDFWQSELQFIGQQEIMNKEVYAAHGTPDGTFGYTDRYDEYRRSESRVSGEMRTLLNHWHLARIFASDPALNASFVSCVPTERVFADNTEHVLWNMVNHSIQARRLVSRNATPKTF